MCRVFLLRKRIGITFFESLVKWIGAFKVNQIMIYFKYLIIRLAYKIRLGGKFCSRDYSWVSACCFNFILFAFSVSDRKFSIKNATQCGVFLLWSEFLVDWASQENAKLKSCVLQKSFNKPYFVSKHFRLVSRRDW